MSPQTRCNKYQNWTYCLHCLHFKMLIIVQTYWLSMLKPHYCHALLIYIAIIAEKHNIKYVAFFKAVHWSLTIDLENYNCPALLPHMISAAMAQAKPVWCSQQSPPHFSLSPTPTPSSNPSPQVPAPAGPAGSILTTVNLNGQCFFWIVGLGCQCGVLLEF